MKLPTLDISYTRDIVSDLQSQIEQNNNQAFKHAEEAYKNGQKVRESLEQTANNTAETNAQLQKVIDNQNDYIELLKQQLEVNQQQVEILKDIFKSGDEGVAMEMEIKALIEQKIDSNHPLWDYVKDKGGDIAVAGITTATPFIYNALKGYLTSKGIFLP